VIEDSGEAIRINPEFAEAYNNRGISYLNLSQYDLAVADFNEAIELNPTIAAPYFNRGLTYRAQARKAEAIADFGKFISLTDNPQWIQMAKKEIEELTK
jgi:tetratricopeptide (TPR) repeat protein